MRHVSQSFVGQTKDRIELFGESCKYRTNMRYISTEIQADNFKLCFQKVLYDVFVHAKHPDAPDILLRRLFSILLS